MSERVWKQVRAQFYSRWVFVPPNHSESFNHSDLRVIKCGPNSEWEVRFDGQGADGTQERLPSTLSDEEAKAAALAIWRMK